jgi:hypothetical protein
MNECPDCGSRRIRHLNTIGSRKWHHCFDCHKITKTFDWELLINNLIAWLFVAAILYSFSLGIEW